MGTKRQPSKFDCYHAAEPNEPMFVLLGRDPTAPLVVTFWRALKLKLREAGKSKISDEKLAEARQCSLDLERWAREHGEDADAATQAFEQVLHDFAQRVSRQR